jgi:hypothetical protein
MHGAGCAPQSHKPAVLLLTLSGCCTSSLSVIHTD